MIRQVISRGAARLPFKPLLLILGLVATVYAGAILFWGDSPHTSLAVLWSRTGLEAAALCLVNYLLRGYRWRLWMAHYDRHFGIVQGLRLYIAGYAFTPTPGNIGEAARGLMLASQPLSAAQSLAIFGAERIADLICLLLLCLPALTWLYGQDDVREALQAHRQVVLAWLVAAALGLAMLAALGLRYRARLMQRLPWLREAARCLAWRPSSWLALTLLAWAAQGGAVWLIFQDANFDVPWLVATGFYALAMVAGALSALPAGLGGTEVVLAGLLVAQGLAPATALALTVLVRLVTLWLAVALGLLALLYSAAIRKDISFS